MTNADPPSSGARRVGARAVPWLTLILIACASSDQTRITLRMTSWQSPEENALDAPALREFERRHPGVAIVNDPVTNQAEYRE